MTGKDLETLLSRYQPAGPSEALRSRVLRSAGVDDRTSRPLWLAISALAACAILLLGAASSVYSRTLRHDENLLGVERAAAIESTAAALGDGPLARQEALDSVLIAERESVASAGGDLVSVTSR
jgi:hypothetical protein